MNDEVPVLFDGLAGALLPEEGWEVLSPWLEPPLGGGWGSARKARSRKHRSCGESHRNGAC
jgi:hypothetical protein